MIKPVKWTARLDLLPEKAVRDIHDASLRILERTGMKMPLSQERADQVSDLGLQVELSTDRIRFPPHVVEAAMKHAPGSYTLSARNSENDILLDGSQGYLGLDGSGTQLLDLETGASRNSTKDDLWAVTRMADALPQISFLCPAISAQDFPADAQPLHEAEAMFTNSSKHVQAMTAVDALNAKGTVEIAAEISGGMEALKARPIVSNFQCSISPLAYEEGSLEAAFVFGEAGIPVGFHSMPIGCGTGPATVAGGAALANAEVLAGMVIFQLFCPGVPTFYASSATMMELRSGGITGGGPEDFLLQAAACQLARFYKVPSSIGSYATGAKTGNWRAGVENSISCAVSLFANGDMICGAGLLDGARVFSYEQLLMDCEIYEMLLEVSHGIRVDDEALAVDVIDRIGPQEHFMTSEHTHKHMHSVWQPTVVDRRSTWDDWVAAGRPAIRDRARELSRQFFAEQANPSANQQSAQGLANGRAETTMLLPNHQPEPLECAESIGEIVAAYEQMGSSEGLRR